MLYSIFFVDNTRFCVPVATILELGRSYKVYPVQDGPSPVEGLINLRGKVMTILNLGRCVNLKEVHESMDSRMIIIKSNSELNNDIIEMGYQTSVDNIGLFVDTIGDVVNFEKTSLDAVPANINHPYYKNIIKQDDGFIIVLDLERLLNLSEYFKD